MDCTMSGMDDKSMIYTRPKSNRHTRSAVCLHNTAGVHVIYLVVLVTNTGISDGKAENGLQSAVKGCFLYYYFSLISRALENKLMYIPMSFPDAIVWLEFSYTCFSEDVCKTIGLCHRAG